MAKPFNRAIRIYGESRKVGTPNIRILQYDVDGKVLYATGAEVPTDGDKGYATGCVFIYTAGSPGAIFWVNEGDADACDFNVAAGEVASSFIALNDTPSNYTAAANKMVKVNGAGNALEFATFEVSNAQVASNAAIDFSKLATLTATYILVGSEANVATAVEMTGDASISNAGVVSVKDLTIANEAHGDMLYRGETAWVRIPAGPAGQGRFLRTNGAAAPTWEIPPTGTTTNLASSVVIDGGANDVTLVTTAQTVGVANLTIPDFAGESQVMALIDLEQTLTNKTLTSPIVETSLVLKNTDRNLTIDWAEPASSARTVTFGDPGGDDSVVYLAATQALTNKTVNKVTLTAPADAATITITNNKTFAVSNSITLAGTDDQTYTFPAASGNVLTADSTSTLTNKTFDAVGTGNALSNVGAAHLATIAGTNATYGIPITLVAVNGGSTTLSVFDSNAPFKFRVIDAWAVNTRGSNSGNWKLDNGTDDITDNVAYSGTDKAISRVAIIDDAKHEIAANGSLRLISSEAADTAIVYITIVRITE